MSDPELVLLHAPSVYDFRQEAILYGPIADFVFTPSVFEAYPLDYALLARHLEREGHRVHIVNLARHMLDDPEFDAESVIAALNPIAFGLDTHWLAQAQGTLAVAQIVKTFHPDTPVILGGFAATYYHRELVEYPQVDYVLRGDSPEDSWLHLMECISLGRITDQVPGLTWCTRSGHVVENLAGPPQPSLDGVDFGYEQQWRTLAERGSRFRFSEALQGSNDEGWPFVCQRNYAAPIAAMARGCTQNCITCSGSAYAYHRLHGREMPAYRPPELLAGDLWSIQRSHSGPVSVPGDITRVGMDYAYRFLRAMRGFPELVFLDLFQPVPRKFLKDVADTLPRFALQIAMDSHDAQVREAMGKSFSNLSLEQTIADALSLGCERFDLHFTIGLPRQTYDSVMETISYSDSLLGRYNTGGRLQPFMAPIAPFIDPGSLAFEEPERVGYRLLFRSLEEHRKALLAPSWKHVLNYETKWMTRDDIVRATYDATAAMARLRSKHGLIPGDRAHKIEVHVNETRRLLSKIDRALALDDVDQVQDALRELKPEIDAANRNGLWYRRVALCLVDSKRASGWGITRDVWRTFKNWWKRRHNEIEDNSENNLH